MYEQVTIYYEPITEVDTSSPTDSDISEKIVEAVNRTLENNNDVVEFSSETDSTLYVTDPTAAPTSSAQQSTIYLLEIRNILLIFLFSWFLLTIYSKLKNLIINYFD